MPLPKESWLRYMEFSKSAKSGTKVMSLIKREIKFQNIRLGKIGDHICTNKRIKLRENRT
jgi:hypothetical protein